MKFFHWSFRWSPLLAALASMPLQANDDWWFDVEVIAFERNVALSSLDEQFEFSNNLSAPSIDTDVISHVIAPNISWLKQGLSVCNETKVPAWPEIIVLPPSAMPLQTITDNDAVTLNNTEETLPQVDTAITPEFTNEINRDVTDKTNSNADVEPLAPSDDYVGLSPQQHAKIWLAFHEISAHTSKNIHVPSFSYCEKPLPWITYEDKTWHIHRPDNRLPAPASLAITPEGQDWTNARHAHLLSKNVQHLTNLSRQIRQNRDLTRLLHIVWRQPVKFGEDNAFNVRLFAGKNYATEFNADGTFRTPLIPHTTVEITQPSSENQSFNDGEENSKALSFDEVSEDLKVEGLEVEDTQTYLAPNGQSNYFFEQLETRLASPAPISFNDMTAQSSANVVDDANEEGIAPALRTPIWQLDGNLKVFLKYINNVPYLHIDSNLLYRQPISLELMGSKQGNVNNITPAQEQLVSLSFNEQRRVISKQLHYFDHPLFGMIVQIRRYHPPSQPEEPEASTPERIN